MLDISKSLQRRGYRDGGCLWEGCSSARFGSVLPLGRMLPWIDYGATLNHIRYVLGFLQQVSTWALNTVDTTRI
jgi:hypothetical protein